MTSEDFSHRSFEELLVEEERPTFRRCAAAVMERGGGTQNRTHTHTDICLFSHMHIEDCVKDKMWISMNMQIYTCM